jgi:hypothetical protein
MAFKLDRRFKGPLHREGRLALAKLPGLEPPSSPPAPIGPPRLGAADR